MVMWITIGIGIALIFGIIYLNREPPTFNISREQYLVDLERYLEGKVERLPDLPQSYRINFNYADKSFIYEDVFEKGFSGDSYKVFLRVPTSVDFTLYFTQKERKDKILGAVNPFAQAGKKDLGKEEPKLRLSRAFSMFNIQTNNIDWVNRLLTHRKAARVFAEFKNVDSRGSPFNSLKIMDGQIVLEFHSKPVFYPNVRGLYNSIGSIEEYLDKMVTVVQAIKEISEASNQKGRGL